MHIHIHVNVSPLLHVHAQSRTEAYVEIHYCYTLAVHSCVQVCFSGNCGISWLSVITPQTISWPCGMLHNYRKNNIAMDDIYM